MNCSRKEFILGSVMASAATVTGCKTIPSAEVVALAAKGFGGSSGLVLNECDIPDEAKPVIVDIVGKVVKYTPEIGQSLEEAWSEIAKEHTNKLVEEGKISAELGQVIITAFGLVTKGFALLEAQFPVVKQSRDLLNAAIAGFGTGFLATFNPGATREPCTINVEAFNTLKKSTEATAVRTSVKKIH